MKQIYRKTASLLFTVLMCSSNVVYSGAWHNCDCDSLAGCNNDDLGACLWLSVTEGVDKTLHLLLDKGVSANFQFACGQSLLYVASRDGHKDCATLLLDRGADVNLETNTGVLPLHAATQEGYEDIIALLKSRRVRK